VFIEGNFSDRMRFPCTDTDYNSTDPAHYLCLNAAGAHLLQHLTQRRLWSFARLPLDGLRSVVFHGNSPTLCIGAGDIWLDHLTPSERRCITGKDALSVMDHPNRQSHVVDFRHFASQGQILGVCMRLESVSTALMILDVCVFTILFVLLFYSILFYLLFSILEQSAGAAHNHKQS
jgi:hypothetical protein